mgnify:CR=1 FL=1
MNNDEKPIGVAVLGLGNVGSEVVRIIEESASDLTARIGAPLVLRGIGVRRVADDRGVPIDLLTDNVEELVSRDDVDVVVELMGPVDPTIRLGKTGPTIVMLCGLQGSGKTTTCGKLARLLAAPGRNPRLLAAGLQPRAAIETPRALGTHAGLTVQQADDVGHHREIVAQVARGPDGLHVATEAGEILTEVDEQARGRILDVVEQVVGQAIADQ